MYDLSYFIANGDISVALAERWESWQRSILTNQSYYYGLIALRASATSQLLTLQAQLTDLQGELEVYLLQQNDAIQQVNLEITPEGVAYQEALLKEAYNNIVKKQAEITAKEAEISQMEADLDSSDPNSYNGQILAVVNQLAFANYFTTAEQKELSRYFIEMDVTESTFVATDVVSALTGSSYTLSSGTLSISGSEVQKISFTTDFGKSMYTVVGGSLVISGSPSISGDIIRGTVHHLVLQ